MALASISNALAYTEPLLWAGALLSFFRVRKQTAMPAFGIFLGIRMVSAFLTLGLSHAQSIAPNLDSGLLYNAYLYTYEICYLASCVALFFALQEIFRNIMAAYPGLSRLGLLSFRWAAIVALVVSSASMIPLASTTTIHEHLAVVFAQIAICVSVLVLCLMAFMAVSIHALGLSYRSRVFGICLGLGLMAVMDLFVNALHISTFYSWPAQVSQIVTIVALLTWVAFLASPEPVKQQAATPVSSSVLQWNDLAQELGPNAPQPATAQRSGFLQNVESVVDRVLAKNSVAG